MFKMWIHVNIGMYPHFRFPRKAFDQNYMETKLLFIHVIHIRELF